MLPQPSPKDCVSLLRCSLRRPLLEALHNPLSLSIAIDCISNAQRLHKPSGIQYRYPLSLAKLCNTRIPSRSMSISICLLIVMVLVRMKAHLAHPVATPLPRLASCKNVCQLPRKYDENGLNTTGSPCKNIPYFISKWVKVVVDIKSYALSERFFMLYRTKLCAVMV